MVERCPTCNSQGKAGLRLCGDRWHLRPGPPIESIQTRASVMTDPTLDDDCALLRMAVDSSLLKYADDKATLLAALTRIAAALKDREHLEEGARLLLEADLTEMTKVAEHDHCLRRRQWLEVERARKQGSGAVVESKG